MAQALLDPRCSFDRRGEHVEHPQNRLRVFVAPDLNLLNNEPAKRPPVRQHVVDRAKPIGLAGRLGPGSSERLVDVAKSDERGLLRAATMH